VAFSTLVDFSLKPNEQLEPGSKHTLPVEVETEADHFIVIKCDCHENYNNHIFFISEQVSVAPTERPSIFKVLMEAKNKLRMKANGLGDHLAKIDKFVGVEHTVAYFMGQLIGSQVNTGANSRIFTFMRYFTIENGPKWHKVFSMIFVEDHQAVVLNVAVEKLGSGTKLVDVDLESTLFNRLRSLHVKTIYMYNIEMDGHSKHVYNNLNDLGWLKLSEFIRQSPDSMDKRHMVYFR